MALAPREIHKGMNVMGAAEQIKPQNATKSALTDLLLESMTEAAKKYYVMSHGLNIRKAPEYLLVVESANRISRKFTQLGYKLEMPVNTLLDDTLIEYEIDDLGIMDGRFDLVLTSRKSGRPRHIVEFKRTLKATALKKDIERICEIARASRDDSRLETGFVAVVTSQTLRSIENRCEELQDAANDKFSEFNFKVSYKASLINDELYDDKDEKKIYAVVYAVEMTH